MRRPGPDDKPLCRTPRKYRGNKRVPPLGLPRRAYRGGPGGARWPQSPARGSRSSEKTGGPLYYGRPQSQRQERPTRPPRGHARPLREGQTRPGGERCALPAQRMAVPMRLDSTDFIGIPLSEDRIAPGKLSPFQRHPGDDDRPVFGGDSNLVPTHGECQYLSVRFARHPANLQARSDSWREDRG